MDAWLAAAPDPAAAAPLLARAWAMLLLLALFGVASVTGLWLVLAVRRQRAARPRPRRQVTSRLSAWDEAGARAEPWRGPDPADLDGLDDGPDR